MSNVQSLRDKFMRLVAEVEPECQNDPQLFDPDFYPKPNTQNVKQFFISTDKETRAIALAAAKGICADCPLKEMCLEVALFYNEEAMIYGGYTPDERAEMVKIRKTPDNLA
jgi:hypothetical protein